MAMTSKQALAAIDELDRNDVEGALNIAKVLLENGDFSEDTGETLTMLQDEPFEYWEKFSKLQDSLQL